MASNKISLLAQAAGTHFFKAHKGDGTIWNVSSSGFVAEADSGIDLYDIAASRVGTTLKYSATFPASIPADQDEPYEISGYLQAGGSPAVGDLPKGSLNAYWDGTNLVESVSQSNIWASTTRTLTSASGAALSTLNSGELGLQVAATFSQSITGLGSLANVTGEKLYFTAKRNKDDNDLDAVIKISENTGLIVLNGSTSVTAGNASITEDDAGAGDITVVLNAAECGELAPGDYFYDIKIIRSIGTPVSILGQGTLVISDTVTDAVA